MRVLVSRVPILLCGLFTVSLAAACSDSEAGSAAMPFGDSLNSRSADVEHGRTAGPSSGSSDISALDPCLLLTYIEVSAFGEFHPEPLADEGLGARSCSYLPVRTDARDLPTLGVDVRDRQSVDTVNNGGRGIQMGNVAGRKAAQVESSSGCVIALEIGPNSRVDVGVTGIDGHEACDLARQVADVVEPKLPNGSADPARARSPTPAH